MSPTSEPMTDDELRAAFDQQAARYDAQWEAMAPIRAGLHLLVAASFADLPDDARVLCVGAGTGAEVTHLAHRFPGWHVTAVEPSGPMLDVCRQRAEREGVASRCVFHEGYLDSLPASEPYHAATCFLVSQFILDRADRAAFFHGIAERLRPDGLLASADLASGANPADFDALLHAWLVLMAGPEVSPERMENARAAYARDVAVLPPAEVASIIVSGGFEPPVQVFQAGLLHAWCAKRAR